MNRDADTVGGLLGDEKHRKLLTVAEKLEDLEALALARRRMRAVQNGEDQLVPLEQVMREFDIW